MADHIAAPPGPTTLRAAAKHVAHDVTRLGQAYAGRGNVFAWTAWYVFCRSVMDFFDPRSPHVDDILAEHYFERPETWRTVVARAARPVGFSDFRTPTNKLAAHLTYARIRYEGESKWSPSHEVTAYLLELATRFLEHLPADRRAWFEEAGIECTIPEASRSVQLEAPTEVPGDSSIAEKAANPMSTPEDDLIERLAESLILRIPALRSLAELREGSSIVVERGTALRFDLAELVSADKLERAYVMHVLAETDGNKTRTAEILGVDQSTLYRKLNRWEIG